MKSSNAVSAFPQSLVQSSNTVVTKSPPREKIIQNVFQDDAELVPGHFIQHISTFARLPYQWGD